MIKMKTNFIYKNKLIKMFIKSILRCFFLKKLSTDKKKFMYFQKHDYMNLAFMYSLTCFHPNIRQFNIC
jgi:hypothetical protein